MLVGVQNGPLQLKWIYRIVFFLVVIYLIAYAIWAANNLAVNLDNQNTDRYATLEFFRLSKIAIDIFTPFLTLFYLYNNLFRWVRILHCWTTVLVIVLEVVCLAWFVIDILDCANVAHCDGDGLGPLGYDIAFWVVVVTLVIRLLCNIIFLWANFYIRRRVEVRNLLDYYANPNRQPIYSADPVASLSAGAYPDNFINSELQLVGGEQQQRYYPLPSVLSKHVSSVRGRLQRYATPCGTGFIRLPTTAYAPRFSFMGPTILEEALYEKEGEVVKRRKL